MLHVDLPGDSRGGVASQVSRLSDVLARRGNRVTVFTLSDPPPGVAYATHPLPLRGASASKPARLVTVPAAFALGRYRDFDVVHAHGDSQLLIRRRIPTIRTFYGSARDEALTAVRLRRRLVQRALYRAERLARRTATVTVGISRATEASVGTLDAIVPCGVDRELFRPGEKSERPSILFVGTMGGRKRGAVLLDLFRREIRPRIPECELWCVADTSPADTDDAGVRRLGVVADDRLAELYRRAWLFVLPSTYEGFGVPYIEAMASGTPFVATPNPGALELVGERSGGLVATDGELSEAICSLLEDRDRRRQLAAAGRAESARYEWDAVAGAYERLYAVAIAGTRGNGRS